MQIIEITPNIYGGHANQTYNGVLPEDWVFIPEEMGELENFPFGSFEVEEIEGVPYMKMDSWVPGVMPEPEQEPIPEPEETSVWDELDAAYREGVESV